MGFPLTRPQAVGVRRSEATPSEAADLVAPSTRSTNPLGLDFSCFGTKSTPIPDPARRGIKLHQLLALKAFIEKHADKSGVLRLWVDRTNAPNHKDSLNLRDLVKYVVNPATAEHACSFVELVVPEGSEDTATPQWFISHWWGEPVLDFIKCTEEHACVRALGEGACYWVCACPLHRPKTPVTPRPSKSRVHHRFMFDNYTVFAKLRYLLH